MFICLDCGANFDDFDTYEEHHPYGMGYASETIAICPNCESTDFVEAVECEHCLEVIAKGDCEYGENNECLCEQCYEELYGE